MKPSSLLFLLVAFGSLLVLGPGCSEGLPKPLELCQSSSDCNAGQLCIGQVCVGKSSQSATETSTQEQATGEKSAQEKSVQEAPTQEVTREVTREQAVSDQNDGGTSQENDIPETPRETMKEAPQEAPADNAACKDGDARVCYDGAPGTESKGVCQTGTQQCVQGKWGDCNGQIVPQKEVCGDARDNDCDGVADESCPCNFDNKALGICKTATTDGGGNCQKPKNYNITDICGDNIDNNCDGNVDETCECKTGATKPCGIDVGLCSKGTQTCGSDNKWGPCSGSVNPAKELCDGKDNDCDGVTDEGCPCNFKNLGQGVCSKATRDQKGVCVQPTDYSTSENCTDGKDNDCDGNINQGCPCNYLQNKNGVCANQRRISNNVCPKPTDYSASEVNLCDGKDNNCNGIVDENCPCNYKGISKGVCAKGVIDSASGACKPPNNYSATVDLCTDKEDNNCDGKTNDNCQCAPKTKQPCGSDIGECSKGYQYCLINGIWGSCINETKPAAKDTCGDKKDNDCDGFIDENCPCRYKDESNGVCASSTTNDKGVCQQPKLYSTTEICGDNVDNDCDGDFEEFCPCIYKNLNAGVCKNAKTDSSGVCQKPNDYDPKEKCGDNIDNDCNGIIDDGCPCLYLNLNAGVCASAKIDNQGNCGKPKDYSVTEICDKKDNDCDGQKDNFAIGSCHQTFTCSLSSSTQDTVKGTVCVASSYQCERNGNKKCKGIPKNSNCFQLTIPQCDSSTPCPSTCPTVKGKRPQCLRSFCVYQ